MSGKILIVDDEEIIRRIYFDRLSAEKYTVETASDGQEALDKMVSFFPNIILLDILMPNISGLQVLEQMKTNPKISNIPVIVLSNMGQDINIKKALELGARDYLLKSSYTPNQVLDKIRANISGGSEKGSIYHLDVRENVSDYFRLSADHPFLKGYRCAYCSQPLQLELTSHKTGSDDHSFTATFVCTSCGKKA